MVERHRARKREERGGCWGVHACEGIDDDDDDDGCGGCDGGGDDDDDCGGDMVTKQSLKMQAPSA